MLKDRALFLYGFDITQFNRYINFKSAALGPELTATLDVGNYTCTQLLAHIASKMSTADGVNIYTLSIDRTINSGTENRIHIETNGSYLDVLFLSGTQADNSPRDLLGFGSVDLTGFTSYSSSAPGGTILLPDYPTWNYNGPDNMIVNDGVKNVSASGIKETLVFAQMRFIQGQWKYINNFKTNTQLTQWQTFLKYATRQLQFEFTPSINEDSEKFYQVTLESTAKDSNGLGYELQQMNGVGLYRFYDSGLLKFRVIPD